MLGDFILYDLTTLVLYTFADYVSRACQYDILLIVHHHLTCGLILGVRPTVTMGFVITRRPPGFCNCRLERLLGGYGARGVGGVNVNIIVRL